MCKRVMRTSLMRYPQCVHTVLMEFIHFRLKSFFPHSHTRLQEFFDILILPMAASLCHIVLMVESIDRSIDRTN